LLNSYLVYGRSVIIVKKIVKIEKRGEKEAKFEIEDPFGIIVQHLSMV
jgi:hypothetical protein